MKCVLLILLCTLSALAQWPSDPAENLLICNHAGEQALPKIAATSDGGCYVTWWDHAGANYDVYLQRLNSDGEPQWTVPCGNHISDYPQSTSLTDWDMIVDNEDHCIIAVNDIRNGDDRDITAYRMSPEGLFVWGEGIEISNNDGFEPDPRIVSLADGSILFAWQNETSINMRRVSQAGDDLWNPPIIQFTQADGASIPRIVSCDSTSFVLSYLASQGGQFNSPRHLYLRKYSLDGNPLWNPTGVPIMTTNGIGIQMRPDVLSDGLGGAYSYWYDARGNVHHCYVQHVNANGVAEWTANGVQVDLSASELQMSPSAVNTGFGVVIFYQTANTSQSQSGVQGQYVSPTGQLNWTTNGVTIAALSNDACFNVRAFVQNGNYSVFFSQYAPGSAINTQLRASQLGEAGQLTWNPAVIDLCSVASEKGRPHSCINSFHQIIAAWPDSRTATMDIYVQNINANGTLGPLPILPPTISITTPVENDTVRNDSVSVVFDVDHFNLDPNNGDGYVLLLVNGIWIDTLSSEAPYPVELLVGENEIYVWLADRQFHPLVPEVSDRVVVSYRPSAIRFMSPAQDTLTFVSPIEIRFWVVNFVVADSGGDGHVRLIRNSFPNDDTLVVELYSTESFPLELSFLNDNEVVVLLVDNDGNPLVPLLADTVYVELGEIISANPPNLNPSSFALSAFPNPFNSTLTIEYEVPNPALVSVDVFDLTGRHVESLINSVQPSGTHSTQWQADNFSSGIYFLSLKSGNHTQSRKIVLLK